MQKKLALGLNADFSAAAEIYTDIAKAKEGGAYKGRKAVFDAETVKTIKARVDAREQISALAREYNVTRPTVYRALAVK